jgi:gas vesicle protein
MTMKEEIEKKEGSIAVPFLIGGLVGAGIALLLAPKAGRELRKDIRDAASETRDKFISAVDRGKEIYTEGTAAVKNAVVAGKNAYTEEMEKHRHVAA